MSGEKVFLHLLTFLLLTLSLVSCKGYNRMKNTPTRIRDPSIPRARTHPIGKNNAPTTPKLDSVSEEAKSMWKAMDSTNRPIIVFVTGPESTGNRYTVELIHLAAGCAGKSSHTQPLDHKARGKQKDWSMLDRRVLGMIAHKNDTQCAVLHRSFPHNNKFVDLGKMASIARESGYEPHVIVLFRLMPAIIKSQIKRKHVSTPTQARKNIKRAYLEIFEDLTKANLPYTTVTYEFMEDKDYIDWMFQEIGLSYSEERIPPFHDENKKYFVHQHLHHHATTS